MEFVGIDSAVLQDLFSKTVCAKCGTPVKLVKQDRQYGLTVKMKLTCSASDLCEEHFVLFHTLCSIITGYCHGLPCIRIHGLAQIGILRNILIQLGPLGPIERAISSILGRIFKTKLQI